MAAERAKRFSERRILLACRVVELETGLSNLRPEFTDELPLRGPANEERFPCLRIARHSWFDTPALALYFIRPEIPSAYFGGWVSHEGVIKPVFFPRVASRVPDVRFFSPSFSPALFLALQAQSTKGRRRLCDFSMLLDRIAQRFHARCATETVWILLS